MSFISKAEQGMDPCINGFARSVGACHHDGACLVCRREPYKGLSNGLITGGTVPAFVAMLVGSELIWDGEHLVKERQGSAGLAFCGQLHSLAQTFRTLALDVCHQYSFHAV